MADKLSFISLEFIICFFFILKVVHLRQRLDNAVSSSRDRAFPLDTTIAMIQTLIDCDEFHDIAKLQVIIAPMKAINF